MSPEDIFASQMWPWPDPALKRDSMGRVLFVNASFLQMYGGTIEDWRGNIVTGWPAPQAPGVPYRFETRLPTPEGEQVYDWMEYTLADGNAFAMARNVTYLFQPTDPQPGIDAEPPVLATQMADTHQVSQDISSGEPPRPAFAEVVSVAENVPMSQDGVMYEGAIAEATPAIDATDIAVPAMAATAIAATALVAEPAIAVAETDPIMEAAQSVQIPEIEDVQVPDFEQALTQITEDPSLVTNTEITAETILADEPAEEERAYDRRTLPIEDDNAVLGNNWRDAVIAKAVGAEPAAAEDESESEEPVEAASEESGEAIRILLAEDNAINALLTRTLLEAEGHVVDTVEDGALAVEAMKTSKYDLIFMDMRMPNMDGLESTRKIRAMNNVPKGLPIIALTANAFDDDRNACFDSGMNDFMTKPVSAEELSEMVRTWTKNLAERNANAA